MIINKGIINKGFINKHEVEVGKGSVDKHEVVMTTMMVNQSQKDKCKECKCRVNGFLGNKRRVQKIISREFEFPTILIQYNSLIVSPRDDMKGQKERRFKEWIDIG